MRIDGKNGVEEAGGLISGMLQMLRRSQKTNQLQCAGK